MNPKSTGILLIVAAALAAFVWYYEIGGEAERLADEAAAERVVQGLDPGDVVRLELTTTDGKQIAAERADGRWSLREPLEYPADMFVLDAMAAAIARLDGAEAIEDAQALDVYGLDAAQREVRFRVGDETQALRIGDATPLGASRYVTLMGSGVVASVPNAAVTAFARTFEDLREKRVVEFDDDAVDHIAVDWPDGGVVLERGEAGNSEWQLVRPIPGPADSETVVRLLSNLELLRADGFVDAPSEQQQASLERPLIAVRLSGGGDATRGGPFSVELTIAGESQDGTRLARGANPGLVRLEEDRVANLPRRLVDYRFKELTRFPVSAAKRIEIGFASEDGVSTAITATRDESGWTSEPERFGDGKLEALVGVLAELRAIDIAAESLGDDELAALELSPPNASFRVYGEAEGEAEAPVLAELRLGRIRAAEGVLAQRARDGSVYVVDLDEAEFLPVSRAAFENHFLAPNAAQTDPASVPASDPAATEAAGSGPPAAATPEPGEGAPPTAP